MALARQSRGNAESGEAHPAVGAVHQDIDGLDVLMNQAPLMRPSESRGNVHGRAQEPPCFHRLAEEALERLAAGVLDQERKPPLVRLQSQGPGGPGRIELLAQRVSVLEPRENFG